MKINSIKKGKRFELDIAHFLTDKLNVKWNRVPMSGAFATINKSEDPRFSGDVFTEDEFYKDLVIECKSYATMEVNDLFLPKSKFYKWINQADTESKGKDWILFIKINHKGVYMLSNRWTMTFSTLAEGKPTIMVDKNLFVKLK